MGILDTPTRNVVVNREERRRAQRHMQSENARWPARMTEWPRHQWPSDGPRDVLSVWRSRDFLVQIYPAPAPALCRLSVNRTGLSGNSWTEGIAWDDLQRIKLEVGYGDHDAVEVFPPEGDLVNVASMRHLWVLPAGWVPFAWRRT